MIAVTTVADLWACVRGGHVWTTPPPPTPPPVPEARVWQTCACCGAGRAVTAAHAYGVLGAA